MVYFIRKIFIISFLIVSLFSNSIIVAQTSFKPSDIIGLKLWLRSDTGIVLSSNMVDQWNDISGNNNNAFQTISSIKPTWYASDSLLNNYPTVKFDGLGSRLETMFVQPDAYSIFIVYAHRNGSNGSFYSTNQSGYPLQRNSVIWPNSNLAPYSLGGGNLLNMKNLYVDVHDFQNDNYSTYLNGISGGNSSDPLPKSGGLFNIGSGGGEPLDGSIAEILIYDKPLSDSFRSLVENYLMNRYAPSVNLGADKAVCSFPITIKAKKKYFTNYLWQNNSMADSLVINSPGKYYVTTTNLFNKVSSDTILISLSSPTYTVDLGNDTTICIGQKLVLNAGPDNLTYAWSNGVITNTTAVNTQATYSVSVADCSGNITVDSIKVIVRPLPSFNFGSKDTVICVNSNFILDPNFTTPSSYSYNWQDNSNSSTYSVSLNGKYYLEVTDLIGCKTSDTVNIQIDASLNAISLGPDVSLCAGNQIALSSGVQPSLSYTWSTGETSSAITVTNTANYSVVITNTNNCTAKDTIHVNILGKAPLADFSFSAGCRNSQINFTNLSIPPMGNIISNSEWNFGNLPSPSTSTLTNSFHTYSDTGSYTVKLTVFTDSGCKETITKTIHIAPTPTVNFSAGVSCQKDSTAFSNQSISSPGYSITAFNWNFGDMSSGSNLQNPKHVFSNQQNYNVKLVATNNAGCKDSLTNVVSVKAQVSASFTNSPACSNTAIIFQDNSIVPAPSSSSTREWIFGGGIIRSGITVPMLYTLSGVYPVTLTVTGQNGCVSKISKLISVFNPPVVSFPVASFCSKDTISIANSSTAQSGIISSYNWKLNNTTFSTVQSPTLTSASAGTYSVRLTVVNSFGCKDSLTNPITVFPLPNVDFTTNPLSYYYIDSPVTFSPSIANANSYLWNISNFSPISIASPTVNFTTEGDYVVSLFLTNQQGCKNTKTKNITVSKRYLDLAILNVRTTKDANGFISVEADIANGGSVPINSIDINYQISDAGNIKETWNGTINPNAFYVYSFTAKSASNKSGTSNNITCVNIEKVNGQIDQNTSNNSLCNSLNTDGISVANPVPNPTSSDITLPVILNKDNEITITIYNSMGQVQYAETTQNGILGLNFITLPTDNYAKGCYIIKTVIDDEIFIKKFIKISNE